MSDHAPLNIVPHAFRPTTGSPVADQKIRELVREALREVEPILVERLTDKVAAMLEAKKPRG